MKIKNCKNVYIYPSFTEWKEMDNDSGDICTKVNVQENDRKTEECYFDDIVGDNTGARGSCKRRKSR